MFLQQQTTYCLGMHDRRGYCRGERRDIVVSVSELLNSCLMLMIHRSFCSRTTHAPNNAHYAIEEEAGGNV